jgi:predicted Zn-ribbon and HTH transcriptional regulator
MELGYQEKILKVLAEATEPLDIEKIRVAVGIGNWNTALKHCLELLLAKKIQGQKTSKSWIFWVNHRD